MPYPFRFTIVAAALLVAVAAFAVAALARPQASSTKLIGVVGQNDAYKITLKTSAGKLVKTLKAGTYTIVIHDDSCSTTTSWTGRTASRGASPPCRTRARRPRP